MIATDTGQVTAYALDDLYDRGIFFVEPGDQVYEGQVVGEHCKDNDIPVNAAKAKQLTNMRAAGKDDAARVRPARIMSLEALPGIHPGRRAGGDHPQVHPHPQAAAARRPTPARARQEA